MISIFSDDMTFPNIEATDKWFIIALPFVDLKNLSIHYLRDTHLGKKSCQLSKVNIFRKTIFTETKSEI
jgi:hypothetical protein